MRVVRNSGRVRLGRKMTLDHCAACVGGHSGQTAGRRGMLPDPQHVDSCDLEAASFRARQWKGSDLMVQKVSESDEV